MAKFEESYKLLIEAEYSGKSHLFLHKNEGESDFTLAGIYRKYHPNAIDWDFIDRVVTMCKADIKQASILLFNDVKIHSQVYVFFRDNFFDKNRLSQISQLKADEIFLFAINVGSKNAVKEAQIVCNDSCDRCLKEDGILGYKTIIALNDIEDEVFSEKYDIQEEKYYKKLIEKHPRLAINLEGWINRSQIV